MIAKGKPEGFLKTEKPSLNWLSPDFDSLEATEIKPVFQLDDYMTIL